MKKKTVDGVVAGLGIAGIGLSILSMVFGNKQAKLQRQEDKADIVKEVLAEMNKNNK